MLNPLFWHDDFDSVDRLFELICTLVRATGIKDTGWDSYVESVSWGHQSRVYIESKLACLGRNETVERYFIRLTRKGVGSFPPGSGPGGRRFESSLPDQLFSITYSFFRYHKEPLGISHAAISVAVKTS
jgi:hypothetical protein